jgi:ParB-like chromosome segregation protein Spo0J
MVSGKSQLGEIVYRDPATLVPYERNSRKHSERQLKQLRAAIDEFGFTQPILLRETKGKFTIGAGHGRQAAALLEPPLAKVPTLIVKGLSDKQWRGLIIADNKIALNAEWDHEMLAAEIASLGGDDFDVAVLGFSEGELADLNDVGELPSEGTGTGTGTGKACVTCPKCQHEFVPE